MLYFLFIWMPAFVLPINFYGFCEILYANIYTISSHILNLIYFFIYFAVIYFYK